MTLEETFLQQNVPGRYSRWTADDDDDHGDSEIKRGANNSDDDHSDSEDDDFYFQDIPSSCRLPDEWRHPSSSTPAAVSSSSSIEKRSNTSNTGVKGVISDYYEGRQREELKMAEERLETLQILNLATRGSIQQGSSHTSNDNEIRRINAGDDDYENDDECDDGEDEELVQIRNRRRQQIQLQNQHQKLKEKSQSANRAHHGTLTRATPEEYITLVDHFRQYHPDTFLIVHLHHSSVYQCRVLSSLLEKAAMTSQMEYAAKFIQVEALEAKPDLDLVILPTVLIYLGGELVCNLVKWMDELEVEYFGNDSEYGGKGSGISRGDIIPVEVVVEAFVKLGVR